MLSWILLVVLGMIWAALLLPKRRRISPASSVEEFERKMTMLAETNKGEGQPGRWVLMPRKGHRFMDPRGRNRARVRRRRRQILTVLAEITGISLLIGVFPPFRPILYATVVLLGVLVLYVALLVRLRSEEVRLAEDRRLLRAQLSAHGYMAAKGNGNGNGHAHGNGDLDPSRLVDAFATEWADELGQGGLQFIDEDVHVIVRTSEELERQAVMAQSASDR